MLCYVQNRIYILDIYQTMNGLWEESPIFLFFHQFWCTCYILNKNLMSKL